MIYDFVSTIGYFVFFIKFVRNTDGHAACFHVRRQEREAFGSKDYLSSAGQKAGAKGDNLLPGSKGDDVFSFG